MKYDVVVIIALPRFVFILNRILHKKQKDSTFQGSNVSLFDRLYSVHLPLHMCAEGDVISPQTLEV